MMNTSDHLRRKRQIPQLLPLTSFLFLIAVLPRCSYTQDIPLTGISATVTTSATSIFPARTRPPSMTTSFTLTPSTNTSTAATSLVTKDNVPPSNIFTPPADSNESNNSAESRKEGVFNYYFLFLAVFGVLVAISLWWIHRRRKRRKEEMRLNGQSALARDLDGWVNTRRWMHGGWRHNQTGFVRREEGLNERGEAPPPYEAKSDTSVGPVGVASAVAPTADISIPLRTLQRDEIERVRPPDYQETLSTGNSPSERPETANTGTARPDTARPDTGSPRPHSSTRQLLPNERIERSD